MRAAGDSRFIDAHQAFCGSWTASVPIFFAQVGISGGASAATAVRAVPVTEINARAATRRATVSRIFIVVLPVPGVRFARRAYCETQNPLERQEDTPRAAARHAPAARGERTYAIKPRRRGQSNAGPGSVFR